MSLARKTSKEMRTVSNVRERLTLKIYLAVGALTKSCFGGRSCKVTIEMYLEEFLMILVPKNLRSQEEKIHG